MSITNRIFFQCLVMIALLLITAASMASVQATIDRSKVYEGETFTLTITSDGAQRSMPDLSLLEKEFQILGTGSSSQMQVINGNVTSRTSWNVELLAKGSGQLLIPSLRIGNQLTNPIQINVSAPPEVSVSGKDQPVSIEIEIAPENRPVYLQQQILYTVRLVFERPLLEGSLSTPAPENAMVEQLGDDNQYSINRSGKPYKVIERTYVIFPEKSGKFDIPSIRFSGRVASPRSKRQYPGATSPGMDPMMKRFFGEAPFSGSGFDSFFDRGKPVTIRSRAISIDVLPRPPSNSTGHWLPAAGLELEDSWAEQPPEFKVGEPVSRSITIKAKGLLATLLPKLEITDVNNVSVYPEQPETDTHYDGTWVYGTSKQTMSYMPTKAGKLEIPELQLSWWDTEAGIERTAILPKWTVDVLPGKETPAEAAAQSEENKDLVPEQNKQLDLPVVQNDEPIASSSEDKWVGYLQDNWLLSLIVVMVAGLAVVWLRRNNPTKNSLHAADKKRTKEEKVLQKHTERELQQRLEKACNANDARSAAGILLEMAKLAKPEDPPKTLPALASMLEHGSEEIYGLDRLLYATGDTEWSGDNFYEYFKQGMVFKTSKSADKETLAPLYPT